MTLSDIITKDIDVLEKRKFKKITINGEVRYAVFICLADAPAGEESDLELSLKQPSNKQIIKVTSPITPGDEFSYTFPDKTKMYLIKTDKITRWEYGFISAGETVKLGRGAILKRNDVLIRTGIQDTIYMKCDDASIDFKIEVWSL